jgi:translation initiation factor IF-2
MPGYRGGAPTPGDHGQKSGGSNNGGPSRSGAAGGSAVRPGGAPTPGNHGQKSSGGAVRPGGAPRPGDHGQVADNNLQNGKVATGRDNLPSNVTPRNEPKPAGAVDFIGDPSLGQALGTLLGAAAGLAVPGASIVNGAGDLLSGGDFSTPTSGGFIGRGFDAMTGGVPGKPTGWSVDRFHGVPGGVSANGGAVNGGPMLPNRSGTVERTAQGSDDAPLAASLRTILSQAGVWPPVKPSAV